MSVSNPGAVRRSLQRLQQQRHRLRRRSLRRGSPTLHSKKMCRQNTRHPHRTQLPRHVWSSRSCTSANNSLRQQAAAAVHWWIVSASIRFGWASRTFSSTWHLEVHREKTLQMREEEVVAFWGPRLYVMRAVSNEKEGTQKLVTLNHMRSSDCQDMAWSAAWTISNGL